MVVEYMTLSLERSKTPRMNFLGKKLNHLMVRL